MRIPVDVVCAIVVDYKWRHLSAISVLVGPPDSPLPTPGDSSLFFAKVLGIDDPLGLWIEWNSGRTRYPEKPVLQFCVPWHIILGVCVDSQDIPGRQYGFTTSEAEVTTAAGPVPVPET